MKIIKISTPNDTWPLERQTPGGSGIWGDYQFFINDTAIKECDYWVVIEGLMKEEAVMCPRENTILITCEPPDIKKYKRSFVNQFSIVISSHLLSHRGLINTQQALPWMIGAKYINGIWQDFKDYDFFKKYLPVKEKEISIIVSNKEFCEGHKQRIRFLDCIREEFKDYIDIFGSGFNHIPDKFDAISLYKYHIVLENCSINDYWSEKLADAFLGWSYPIYYGCTNIGDYFSENSLSAIDIYNIEDAIKIIRNIIDNNYYDRYLHEIKSARELILDNYNLFPFIISIINDKKYNNCEKDNVNQRVVLKKDNTDNNLFLNIKNIFCRGKLTSNLFYKD